MGVGRRDRHAGERDRHLGRIGSRAALYEHLLNLLALCGLSG